MKVLVTGGTGFLGSTLWPLLKSRGHDVALIQRSASRAADEAGVTTIRASLADRESVQKALRGVDVLYHLAGRVSWNPDDAREMYSLHVEGTKLLLEEAHAAKVKRIVLASTSGTIGVSTTDRVATEDDTYPIEVVGRWPYYASKIFEERLALGFCRDKQLPLVVLNPSLLLGPGDDRLSSTGEVLALINGEIPAVPSGGLSLVDVRDAAEAFANALDRGLLYERHLLGGANLTLREFFDRLGRIADVPSPRFTLPESMNGLGAYAWKKLGDWSKRDQAVKPQAIEMGRHFFYIDSTRAKRELGFTPRDPQETLASTVTYLRRQMPQRIKTGRPEAR